MKPRITPAQAQAFAARWRRVNAAERKELRGTSMDLKFRQLASLMALVRVLGWAEGLTAGETEVRQRWQRLRRAYGV